MKIKEVRKLNADEIKLEAARLRRRLFDLRTQMVTQKVEDTSQIRKARKDLARLLTESSARRIAAQPAAAQPSAEPAAKTGVKRPARAGAQSATKPATKSATRKA